MPFSTLTFGLHLYGEVDVQRAIDGLIVEVAELRRDARRKRRLERLQGFGRDQPRTDSRRKVLALEWSLQARSARYVPKSWSVGLTKGIIS